MLNHLTKIRDAAAKLGEAETADILLFNGEIARNIEHRFIATVFKRKRRPNVILVLVTSGGDADAAYRIGRCLRKYYETATVFITGRCKSAGTLVAIAADKLVFSEFGELGPLDVQLGKQDDSFECGSDPNIGAAIKQLELSSRSMFENVASAIEQASGGRITFKTAAEISCELVGRLFGNLYSQIDPMQIGETSRLQTVAREYGERLADGSWNMKTSESLELLVSSYASPGFVIDFEEAQSIFKNVVEAKEGFEDLQEALGDVGLLPLSSSEQGDFMLAYLNKEIAEDPSRKTENAATETADGSVGVGEDAEKAGEATPA